jgi:flagellar hook-length control protein FliK
MAISFPDTVSAAVKFTGGPLRAHAGFSPQSQTVIAGDDCDASPAVESRHASDEDFDTVLAWMMGGIGPQFQQTLVADKSKTAPMPAVTLSDAGNATDSTGIGTTVGHVGSADSTPASMEEKSAATAVPQGAAVPSEAATIAVPVGVGTSAEPTTVRSRTDQEVSNPESSASGFTSTSSVMLPPISAHPVSRLPDTVVSESTDSDSEISVSASLLSVSEPPVVFQTVESMIKSVRIRTASTTPSPVIDNSGFRHDREPHRTAAALSESVSEGVVQLNSANSFSEAATPVSGEVRRPLSHQVSQAILEHAGRHSVRSSDSLTVRLDPPELGEMSIELSKTADGLAVRVTAREAVTMDMLLTRGHEIESHLRGQQMDLKSLEFLHTDMSGNPFSQGQQNPGSRTAEKLMNQVRRGSRTASPANTSVGRITMSDSAYGLSFRA